MVRSVDTPPGADPFPGNPDWLPGDRYRVRERLGPPSGQGEVYVAFDTVLRREVALKRVRADLEHDPERLRAFASEAHHASRLNDPHLASLYDVLVSEDDHLILVMEYVPGCSLRERMQESMDLAEFWDIAIQIVEAVSIIHRNGFVHRDLKPENIMLTPAGQVKILDFGLSVRIPGQEPLDSATVTMGPIPIAGTPPYMAPEVYRGADPDPRSDLFALGVVFYEMIAGRRPFTGKSRSELRDRILGAVHDPPGKHRSGLPAALEYLVGRMLEKDASARPPSAAALLGDLVAAQHGNFDLSTVQIPTPPAPERPRFLRWVPVIAAVAGTVAVLALSSDARFRVGRWFGWPPLPEPRRVAVLPATSDAGDAHLAAFGLGLTEILGRKLAQPESEAALQVMPPDQILRKAVSTPAEARVETGANLAVGTHVSLSGNALKAVLSLWDTRTTRLLDRQAVHGTRTEPCIFAQDVLSQLTGMLGAASDTSLSIDAAPSSAFWFSLEGSGHLRQAGDTTEVLAALEHFERAANVDSRYLPAWVGIAQAELDLYEQTKESAHLEQAADAARQALELVPGDPDARMVLADIHYAAADWDSAIAGYAGVAADFPHRDDAYLRLAASYRKANRPEDSVRILHEAIQAKPTSYPRWWNLAFVYYTQDRALEAIDAYRGMITAAPDLYLGYQGLGGMLVREAFYTEAIEVLRRGIALKAEEKSYSNLATAYFNERRFADAVEFFLKSISLGYEQTSIWMNLADAYYYYPLMRDRAEAAYRTGIALGLEDLQETPDDPWTVARIADAYARVGEPDSAAAWVSRAQAVAGSGGMVPGEVHQLVALALWQLGRKDEAMVFLEKAVEFGVPRAWIRDSAMFDPWREDPRFRELVGV